MHAAKQQGICLFFELEPAIKAGWEVEKTTVFGYDVKRKLPTGWEYGRVILGGYWEP